MAELPAWPLTARAGSELTAHKNQPSGYAGLDASSLIPAAEIPSLPEAQIASLVADLAAKATLADLAAKAPLAGPVLTGDPRAPTPAAGDSDTSIATSAFVKGQIPISGTRAARPAAAAAPDRLYYATDNGIAYLSDGAAWTAIDWTALRVGGLPTSPAPEDGQIVVATADAAAGILWRFRYNAGTLSAYKWEFVGGSPLVSSYQPRETLSAFSASTWGAISANDPSLTLPLAGDWCLDHGASFYDTASSNIHTGVKVGATEPIIDINAVGGSTPAAGTNAGSLTQTRILTAVAAGTVVTQRYYHTTNSDLSRRAAFIRATPIRVI